MLSLTKIALLTGGAIGAALAGINIAISLKCPQLKHINVPISKLPKHLRGLRILHISDIHNVSTKHINVNIWDMAFEQRFDIAVITGDMTKAYFDQILPLKGVLTRLSERAPTFFVDGNHEQAHFVQMKAFMESCGIQVLDNKKVSVDINGESLEILGIRDFYFQKRHGFEPLSELMEDEPKQGFRLFLSHQPQVIDRLAVDFEDIFVISGHTHGGQIRLPFVKTIVAPGQGFFPKYGDGLYKVKRCYLYISRGIGASRISVRFFNRPEVGVIRLVRGR